MKELSLDVLQSQLTKKQQLLVNEGTVAEIQKLAEDPDYGPEFLETYIDHLNIFKESERTSHDQYLNAIKFFSLVEAGNSLTDAYVKTFPERYDARKENNPDADKSIIRGEASRYNNTKLVNEIRKIAAIPVQLIHRHLLHEAILTNAQIMRTAKSEMVKQKAADTLIRELKPSEDQVLKLEVEDGARSAIEELRQATERLAVAERRSIEAGAIPLKEVAESKLFLPEEAEDAEVVENG
jgi:hypothetical protein